MTRLAASRDKTQRLGFGSIVEVTATRPDPTRRSEHSRTAILAATIALVAELGYENVSIEGIARQAGVGKQTIYRWWPKKGEVVLEALESQAVTVNDFPDSGDIVEDLRVSLVGVSRLLGATEVGAAYRGLIAAAQSDPALSRLHRDRLIEPASEACRRRLALARERGEIRADVEDQDVIDLLWGAIYYRLLLHTRPLEPGQIDNALEIALNGLRPTSTAVPT
jgi:AcrR family transcriptional regulator